MSTEAKNGLNYIIQAINNIVDPKVKSLRYDKTYRAKITGKINNNVYKVQINSAEYELPYNGDLNIGDIVKVKAPLNNFSDIYIEPILGSYNGKGIEETLPIGSVIEWYSNTVPNNWLLCNGQEISRTEYFELFSVLGTVYGEGNGLTTFNLPNRTGKFGVGIQTSDMSFNTLNKTGGEKTHILTINEMPSHKHEMQDNDAGYYAGWGTRSGWLQAAANSDNGGRFGTDYTGGNQPHNNLPPYITTNYIIKAKNSYSLPPSQINNNLIKEYVLSEDANSFTINNLDIDRDGGIYDIYIQFQQSISSLTAVGLTINDIKGNVYDCVGVKVVGDTVPGQIYSKEQSFYRLGALRGNFAAFCKLTINKAEYSNTRYFINSTMYSEGNELDYENISGRILTSGKQNLTSITIYSINSSEKFLANGTKVSIYKR